MYLVPSTCYLLLEIWRLAHGTWYLVHGACCQAPGARRQVHCGWNQALGPSSALPYRMARPSQSNMAEPGNRSVDALAMCQYLWSAEPGNSPGPIMTHADALILPYAHPCPGIAWGMPQALLAKMIRQGRNIN